jgi:hypothetical protein
VLFGLSGLGEFRPTQEQAQRLGRHRKSGIILSKQDKKPPRRERRRTAETVVRTHLAVITAPTQNPGSTIGFQHEVDLVKASVLYADNVEVLSLGSQMINEINTFAAGEDTNLYSLLCALDDDTLRYMHPNIDPEPFRELVPILASLDAEAMRDLAASDPQRAAISEFADTLDESNETLRSSMAQMREVAEQLRLESGLAELEPAIRKKLVRFNEALRLTEEPDTIIAAFIQQLKLYLQNPTWFVLLDDSVASLARSMISDGMIKPPQRAISNAGEAALGAGFLARLPAFPGAPMDELLDLRRDLGEPLGCYRRQVSRLRGELRTEPFDEHIEAEIDAVWRADVNPAIGEIRLAMADHGLVREILRAFGDDLSSFVDGTWLRAGVAVVSADVVDLGRAVTAAVAAGTAIAPTVVKGLRSRATGRAEAKAHDLFYLYEVDRRLA